MQSTSKQITTPPFKKKIKINEPRQTLPHFPLPLVAGCSGLCRDHPLYGRLLVSAGTRQAVLMGTYVIPVRASRRTSRREEKCHLPWQAAEREQNIIASFQHSSWWEGRAASSASATPFLPKTARGAHSEVALNRDVSTMLRADVSVCAAAAFQPIKKKKKRLEAKMNKLSVTY